MPYTKPESFRAALESRLRLLAQPRDNSSRFQRLQTLFCMDRLAQRLFREMPDTLVKGGYAMELRLQDGPPWARTTKDIDVNLPVGSQDALERLQRAGQLDLGDFLQFEIAEDHEVAEDTLHGGTRFRVQVLLGGKTYQRFKVDAAFGDCRLFPCDTLLSPFLPEWLHEHGIPSGSHRVISRPQHLAEKLHAYTKPRPHENSRTRDLPDMALLARHASLDGSLLDVVKRLFSHRATHDHPRQLPEPPATWAAAYERLTEVDQLPWATLDDLMLELRAFWSPLLDGACDGKRWDPGRRSWV